MRILNFGVLLGLVVGWLLVRGGIWLSLDLFGFDFHSVLTISELFSIVIIAGIAFHFSMLGDYKSQIMLAAKYLAPMGGLFVVLFGINSLP
ncbi:hypothetical protein [Pseudoalteromonas luteoviolacea]|uniref:Uncharacterized protein n=1 Tax=Pseudoalteromonas luteoviolacea DSM 6061 TaxID=1365250 RepID=A0A166W3K6_9GAMM|nr:hypothetical protein [Pseudoalteromonas luteoviolacea]KZN35372.1 hypothetical protein N475_18695 [Pseudoalteromonas luteoviolacea DSM 6061]KZN53493.1 hypothetical protein N474_20765 [Pseudoalteromonas luteoviolacea CPMOR-2]MBE0387617.1 hypothetical protein [Pseudoalteromonas luteoviolacea DSM 6061]TQF72404.1 hypothetical protein FLM44_15710 [Pseudoalteromonas luteoviolacea]